MNLGIARNSRCVRNQREMLPSFLSFLLKLVGSSRDNAQFFSKIYNSTSLWKISEPQRDTCNAWMNNVLGFYLKWVSHNHWCSRVHVKERMTIPSTQQQNCREILFYFLIFFVLGKNWMDALLSFRKWVIFITLDFGAAAFSFAFAFQMGFTIGCCSIPLGVDDACNWKNWIQNLWASPQKGSKFAFILEKTNSEAQFERTISEPCAAEISGKKKTQNHEGRLWQSSRLGLFWASNPKIDQSPQMGFEVPGSQSNKQTRWPKNHPQWHFISIGLWDEEALKQW